MKKITVLSLVLVAVLAIGSVGFAAELYPVRTDKGDRHNLEFEVVGVVEPYASMYYLENEDEGPRVLDLWWDGSKGESDNARTFFVIKSNTPIALAMEFGALRTWNPYHQQFFYIDTNVQIDRFRPADQIWQNRLNGTVTADGPVAGGTFYAPWIQTVQRYDYRMTVSGALKDIQDQSAGEYETVVLLTISGYPPAAN